MVAPRCRKLASCVGSISQCDVALARQPLLDSEVKSVAQRRGGRVARVVSVTQVEVPEPPVVLPHVGLDAIVLDGTFAHFRAGELGSGAAHFGFA